MFERFSFRFLLVYKRKRFTIIVGKIITFVCIVLFFFFFYIFFFNSLTWSSYLFFLQFFTFFPFYFLGTTKFSVWKRILLLVPHKSLPGLNEPLWILHSVQFVQKCRDSYLYTTVFPEQSLKMASSEWILQALKKTIFSLALHNHKKILPNNNKNISLEDSQQQQEKCVT